ncbi:MAG: hypothetical protein QT07_C0004G0008 [archaeon GW2011_AR16]|nr:MAG: hypothetical protein QT07_C0004G0008 [archaeon GW2011_AR16]
MRLSNKTSNQTKPNQTKQNKTGKTWKKLQNPKVEKDMKKEMKL